MFKINKKILVLSTLFLPVFVFAATKDISTLIGDLGGWVDSLVPIVMTLALLYFFFGLAKYILAAGDETKAKEGKSIMTYGVIALFVMISVWGLVGLLQRTLSVQDEVTPTVKIPTFK